MIFRKTPQTKKTIIPATWCEQVTQTLTDHYDSFLKVYDREFNIFAYSHSEEFLLIVSCTTPDNPDHSPSSLFISADLTEKTDASQLMDQLIDVTGIFFDQYFNQEGNWTDFSGKWEKDQFLGLELHYKISRENMLLTIEANRLLGEEF